MEQTNLLSLPAELLDQIYSYLDWHPSKSLEPARQDVINISLTCWGLRNTILPRLFATVKLNLRWTNGALIEPSLFMLRNKQPHLAKHVRNVFVETRFGQVFDQQGKLKAFTVPDEHCHWDAPSLDAENYSSDLEQSHRQRVRSHTRRMLQRRSYSEWASALRTSSRKQIKMIASKLLQAVEEEDAGYTVQMLSMQEDELKNVSNEQQPVGKVISVNQRSERAPILAAELSQTATKTAKRVVTMQLDALMLVVLCLPPTTNSFIFRSVHDRSGDMPQNSFALHVATAAIAIFGDRLLRLAMITSPRTPRNYSIDADLELVNESSILTEDILDQMLQVDTLVLSDLPSSIARSRELLSPSQAQWQVLAPTLTSLELWNMSCDSNELLRYMSGFANLQRLALHNVMLSWSHRRQRQNTDHLIWLSFLIELRRARPNLSLKYTDLKYWNVTLKMVTLSDSVLRWLQHEAVPLRCDVGFDRETRLTEDYESFLPLWLAEDSERGEKAQDERKDGALVDLAMTNRWKTFANFR